MSRKLLLPILLLLLLAGCVPASSDETAGPAVSQATLVPPAATATPTLEPVSQAAVAEPSETYMPVVQSDEPATPTPLPVPTSTPQPTPTPTTPINSIRLEPVLSGGLVNPLYLTHADDERLFVVEQVGRVQIIENGRLRPQPFIDLRDRVGSVGSEQGLLSIAFHPQYGQPDTPGFGKFYVNYTNYGGDTVISRFSVDPADPNLADKTSETVLLTVDQPYPNHNGGLLKFGPDGYLYVGLGDGGSANDPLNSGQSPNTLLGSILRLDVSDGGEQYRIPADNPFLNDSNRFNEIWAFGVRNPWRFSFDRLTGDLYMADVGQNKWEEVNFQPGDSSGGENYGWNKMEGTHCFPSDPCDPTGLILPIAEYGHDQGCSITGGYVYRGPDFPQMNGNYFFGDYCTGVIWRIYPDGAGGWETVQVLDSDLVLTSFGEDVRGELYAMDRTMGSIFRIVPGN
jgi:glucose/arabinose dehydrogenase